MKIKTEAFDIGGLLSALITPVLEVYPVIAVEGAKAPFAVYRRTGMSATSTKDRHDEDQEVTVEVTVAAPNYPSSIDKAKKIKKILEGTRGRWQDLVINGIRMTTSGEDSVNGDIFLQYMTFRIVIDSHNFK